MKPPHDRIRPAFFEREPVRYVLVGGLNTAVTYAAYLALLPLIGYALAYTVSFAGGIFFAYYLNARLVFRRPLQRRHALAYPTVYLLQYVLGLALTTAFVEVVGINAEFVPPLVIVFTLPFTFWLSRWIIKRQNKTGREVSVDSDTSARGTT